MRRVSLSLDSYGPAPVSRFKPQRSLSCSSLDRGHQLLLTGLVNFPAAHVMTAGDDARLDSFSDPGAHHEISNLSFDPHQITGAHAELARVTRMQPERIRVSNLVQPFCVRAARVNLNRQTKSRNQNRLIRFEIVRMNVAPM